MIIIETSVWVDHFRKTEPRIGAMLADNHVRQHPLVTAELAMGNLYNWRRTIALLDSLPAAVQLTQAALIDFVEQAGLAGSGIGVIDAHLLGSARASGARLWTRDKRLNDQAEKLGLAWRA